MFSALVAATGRAMLDALPQLQDGCINYWEAGNWALNDAAEPQGRKLPRTHRKMHLHLLGRSRTATHPAWCWGESPAFPAFADRHTWAAMFERLTPEECCAVVRQAEARLKDVYAFSDSQIDAWAPCAVCRYPMSVR
jgi:hypothetical protein